MNQSKSGLYHYIHSLFQKGELADRQINHVINDEHHGYCLMNFYLEFPANRQKPNSPQKQFFHGLVFHNHHFSIEKNYQYSSDVHYTCAFINPNNKDEILKISIFFNRSKNNQITRVNYRYKKDAFGFKGELDFNDTSLLSQNLAKILKKLPKALDNAEFISLQQLINVANSTFNLRFTSILEDYHETYDPKIETLKNKISRYQDCKKQYYSGNVRNLDLGRQALDELNDIIEILNTISNFLEPNPEIMSVKYYEEQIKKLMNDMEFTHCDNLANLQQDLENKKNSSELVELFIQQNITAEKDITPNIINVYIESVLGGQMAMVQHIQANFFLKINHQDICQSLLNKIESEHGPENVKRIELAKMFFKTSVHHVKALRKNIRKLENHGNLEANRLVEMFIQKKFQAFSLYLYYAHVFKLVNLNLTIKMMERFANHTPDEKDYFHLIQQKITP
jgi:hypothetical protein